MPPWQPGAIDQWTFRLLDTISEKNRAWMKSRMLALTAQELQTLTSAMEILAGVFAGPVE
jgi:hypothetical protein